MTAYDYVIVGAGSAGAVLANRLSENATVLLLEAGGSDRSPWVQIPIGYGKVYYDERVNWKYTTEPVEGLGGARSYWPRGKVLGGSSAINAMVYVRGHPRDYDDWGRVAPGWSWADVAPVFRRMEDWSGGADNIRGSGGPLSVHDISADAHPMTRTYLKAAEQTGIPVNPDYNGAEMEGAALYQITTKNGRRASTARAYLRPALGRANLDLQLKAHVTRVEIEEGRAVGVEYRQNGEMRTAEARREVILSAGAINSPQLLQLSGIGEGGLLRDLGIEVKVDAPQVGQNLQDHLGYDHLFTTRVPTLNRELRPLLGKLQAGLKYLLTRKGPLSLSLNQGGGFVRLNPDSDRPDTQIYFSPVSYTRAPVGTRPLMNPDPFDGFLMGFNPCKPTSRGHLHIRSADPFEAPEMRPNYLSTENDVELMLKGSDLMRKLADAPALRDVITGVLYPDREIQSRKARLTHIRANAWTVFHQCGTCRMGGDPATSVVDARLRVHGVAGLRVADASIFPDVTTGNTNAPAIMVGERASDIIAEDWR